MSTATSQASPRTNNYPGTCPTCRSSVPPGKGFIRSESGRWITYCQDHYPERIAPPAPPRRELTAEGAVRTPYEPVNLPLIKGMPGARWDGGRKCWTVSLDPADRPRLLELADRLGLEVAPSLRVDTRTTAEIAVTDRARAAGLYSFQVEGVAYLGRHPKALLADDMGLGKTVQVLLALDGPTIVVAPNSLKFNWRDECRRWRPGFTPVVLSGKGSLRTPAAGEILIVNYDVLPDTPPDGLADVILVVDEAHNVKSYKALRSKRVKALAAACGRVWALTGTPLPTRPGDLWGVLESTGMAGLVFGSFGRFMRLFGAQKGQWGGIEWGSPDPSVPEMLRRVMLRRRRTEVLPDLPRKTYQDITVNGLSAGLRRQLDAAWDEAGDYLEVTDSLPSFEEFSRLRALLASERIPAMLEIVADHEESDTPLVVFSAHRGPVDALESREGWAVITGDTKAEDRQGIVNAFQAGNLKGVALTIAAGGVGLTLTRAHRVLFTDLDWTPALNAQAEDRICRIGQQSDKCIVMRMVSDHPLEKHVHKLIARKIALVEGAIERETQAVVPESGPVKTGETDEEYHQRMHRAAKAAESVRHSQQQVNEADRKERAKSKVAGILDRLQSKKSLPDWPLTAERANQIRGAIRYLASVCDYACEKDGQGFNKPDAYTGHVLAATGLETEDELRAAWLLTCKYKGQCQYQFPLLWKEG